jgi:hypothetical protein
MKLLVGVDSLLELLLAHKTPRTDSVAHDLDVKLGHSAEGGPEHALEGRKERDGFLVKWKKINEVM